MVSRTVVVVEQQGEGVQGMPLNNVDVTATPEGISWLIGTILSLIGLKKAGSAWLAARERAAVKADRHYAKLEAIHEDVTHLQRSHKTLDTKLDGVVADVEYLKGVNAGMGSDNGGRRRPLHLQLPIGTDRFTIKRDGGSSGGV